MTEATSKRDEKIRSFWDRYINKLHESGIKPPFDRWMVLRAEHYIAAHADRRLAEQTSVDVNAYLAELGRKPGLKAWQFRQAVDAIQKLFELAGVSWLGEVDWGHWRDSARGLEATHPTVARDYSPLPGGGNLGLVFLFGPRGTGKSTWLNATFLAAILVLYFGQVRLLPCKSFPSPMPVIN